MCLCRIHHRLSRSRRGTVQAFTAIVAVDPLGFVFVPALPTNYFRHCCRRHASDSFFGLVGGAEVDVFGGGVFDSLPEEGFSLAVGASFLAASW